MVGMSARGGRLVGDVGLVAHGERQTTLEVCLFVVSGASLIEETTE
jgi:hypothetical protein